MDFERSIGNSGINPWQGFAHAEHRTDEYEALNKTLRFALIQLNKFWVEVNSFPVFMNELKGASIQEIERLFVWLQSTPSWSERVPQPRLIPELARPQTRELLIRFAEDVRAARRQRIQVASFFGEFSYPDVQALQPVQAKLSLAIALTRQLGVENATQVELQSRTQQISDRIGRNNRLQRFFSRLCAEYGFPEALNLREAGRVFQAAAWVRSASPAILSWRKPQILGPQQRIRIEAWQDRARPILEARKRLQSCFRLEDVTVTPEELRTLAGKFKSVGPFRAFNGAYKEALKQTQALLQVNLETKKNVSRETPQEISEKLGEWASFLENKAAFESNAEARAFFAPHFQGVETDFSEALAANTWASSLRTELKVAHPEESMREAAFCAKLMEAVFGISQEKLEFAASSCAEDEAKEIQEILLDKEYSTGREFADVGCEEEARLLETLQLQSILSGLQTRAEVRLDQLSEIRAQLEGMLVLLKRIESSEAARASLKTVYAGENTDLGWIDSALAYVEFVEGAGLPQSLHNSLLGPHGPQRLHDTRTLVAPALNGLAAVKEHLNRVEVATHGQSRSFENRPLIDLMSRIQLALKQPAALGEWVSELKQMKQFKGVQGGGMKIRFRILPLVFFISAWSTTPIVFAEPSVSVTGVPVEEDSTITIRKGDRRHGIEPDFEITHGKEEISGDPVSGLNESYQSWKQACADWKKEMREMNGAALISLNCGTPHPERDKSSRVTQISQGTYQLKVRVRDQLQR